jgi:hypothetical protein
MRRRLRPESYLDHEEPVDLAQRVQEWLAMGEDYNTEFKSDRKQLGDNDLAWAPHLPAATRS